MPEINLKKNILVSGSFRIVILIMSFLISWVTARYLGVELKGKLSYVITLGGFAWIVLDLGLFHSFPYLLRKNPDKTPSLLFWSLSCLICELLILLTLGIVFLPFWNKVLNYDFSMSYIMLFIGYIVFTKAFNQLQTLYVGLDRVFHSSLSAFLNAGISLLLLVTAYVFLSQANRLSVVMGVTLFSLVFCVIFLVSKVNWGSMRKAIDFRFIKYSYSFGLRAFISSLMISLLLRSDIVIVKHFMGFRDVGIYSMSAHIVDMLQVASNMVGGLLLAKLSDTRDEESKWIMMRKMLMVFFVFLTIGNLGFVLIGKYFLGAFYGRDFVPAYFVYLWLIPASYGLSFGSLFNNYLNSKGFPLVSIILPAIALALNVGLNFVLIPLWGINGAAISTSIAYLFWFILIIAYEEKDTRGRMLKYLIPVKADWQDLWKTGQSSWSKVLQRFRKG